VPFRRVCIRVSALRRSGVSCIDVRRRKWRKGI